MKWSNKNKQERREHWFAVPPPEPRKQPDAYNWCRKSKSDGKFYYHYTNTRVWFEYESDAMVFALK